MAAGGVRVNGRAPFANRSAAAAHTNDSSVYGYACAAAAHGHRHRPADGHGRRRALIPAAHCTQPHRHA